jgi:isoleucyl-tRNA synthetase
LIERIKKAYDEFEFHIVYHSIYDFCVNDLSALYLDMSKDRLYCEAKDSNKRRSAQTAIAETLDSLIRLLSPILSYTAENIYSFSRPKEKSVFLLGFPEVKKEYLDEKLGTKWDTLLLVREKVYKVLEEARSQKTIASSVEAAIEIFAEGEELKALKSVEDFLPMILIVSEVKLTPGKGDPKVIHASGHKCERCWMWSESVGTHKDHLTLCDRCASVVK